MRLFRLLFILALTAVACNLSLATPTPLPQPTPLAPPTVPAGPITPQATIDPDCPDTPLNWVAYTVERGDTLSLLAQQTDSTIAELLRGNCIDSVERAILIDTVLYLPRVPVVGD